MEDTRKPSWAEQTSTMKHPNHSTWTFSVSYIWPTKSSFKWYPHNTKKQSLVIDQARQLSVMALLLNSSRSTVLIVLSVYVQKRMSKQLELLVVCGLWRINFDRPRPTYLILSTPPAFPQHACSHFFPFSVCVSRHHKYFLAGLT